ncbi:biotin transporter BioY [Silvibacterium dinghuense]|uniref:Biotin transporter n=1 Tax=Silvibacterium dinghuense TaxID=1560006 RepID=A0A4Q1S7V4_9BACT|nr:biotin transporter BioY [Silvibacterium dinghuense]RXS93051.1 biotin transporter BioY [Silvibacterium dinghuense]GGG89835.1 biotin transporter BioY [Silvibacterium dinghuense]
MMEMRTATATSTTRQNSASGALAHQTGLAVAGSALVALSAHVSIPLLFTPVPLTTQNFAVILLALLLEPATAVAAMVLYLIEGASGLPVFTPAGPGGMLQLFGATGGFLLSYPLVAACASRIARMRPMSFSSRAAAGAIASLVLYVSGASWLALFSHLSLATVVKMAVLPFVAGDALKVVAAAAIVVSLASLRRRMLPAR